MKGKRNDFSMTFYNGEERRLFLRFVHDTDKAMDWANSKGIEWTHAMVYDRRTRGKKGKDNQRKRIKGVRYAHEFFVFSRDKQ